MKKQEKGSIVDAPAAKTWCHVWYNWYTHKTNIYMHVEGKTSKHHV